jgi:murein L,D-transpeptidase YafK
MASIRRKSFFPLRLLVLLLILSCLSPSSPSGNAKPSTLASLLSPFGGEVRLVIWKSQYTLTLYKGDMPVKTYRAVFGKGFSGGDKRKVGDKRTPEGNFYICTMNHSKRFYKFMGLSYPGVAHARQGLQSGLITEAEFHRIRKATEERRQPPWNTNLGGAVGIHGRMLDSATAPKRYAGMNWTDGCIAMENPDVDEIFSVVSIGTPVTILP